MQNTILIVDDHKQILVALSQLLETAFSEVIGVNDPNRIIPILHYKEIDLVLLDMNFSAGINSGNEGLFWLKKIKILCQKQMIG